MKTVKEKINNEGAWAAVGFAFVLIVIGIPVWWHTTTVYRAALPYSEIKHLSQYHTYQRVSIEIVSNKWQVIESKLSPDLLNISSFIKFNVSGRSPTKEEESVLSLNNINNIDSKINVDKKPIITLFEFISSNEKSDIYVSNKRFIYYKPSCDIKILSQLIVNLSIDPLALEKVEQNNWIFKAQRNYDEIGFLRQVPTRPKYDIIFTLMVPQPHILRPHWDASKAIEIYLKQFSSQIKNVMDIKIRSQVMYMTSLNAMPEWSSQNNEYILPESALSLTINAIESKLGSFVSTRQSLHFLVYIPKEEHIPLQIHSSKGPVLSNSFLVPRWGGVLIYNPNLGNNDNISYPYHFDIDSQIIMKTVITHLHQVLPIPHISTSIPSVSLIPKDNEILYDWQIDALARARNLMYLHNVRIALQSLCELVGEISNMVVSDEVANWVSTAVEDYIACVKLSNEGDIEESSRKCTNAFKYSDAAFFHPSMLALLYFPDNQKYAIYIPLFLPVSIPVIFSLKMIFKLLKKS